MKTTVEILAERLGKTLARMFQAAAKGKRELAYAEMTNAGRELKELRRAGGLPDVPADQFAKVQDAWKKTIEDCVRGAKAGV